MAAPKETKFTREQFSLGRTRGEEAHTLTARSVSSEALANAVRGMSQREANKIARIIENVEPGVLKAIEDARLNPAVLNLITYYSDQLRELYYQSVQPSNNEDDSTRDSVTIHLKHLDILINAIKTDKILTKAGKSAQKPLLDMADEIKQAFEKRNSLRERFKETVSKLGKSDTLRGAASAAGKASPLVGLIMGISKFRSSSKKNTFGDAAAADKRIADIARQQDAASSLVGSRKTRDISSGPTAGPENSQIEGNRSTLNAASSLFGGGNQPTATSLGSKNTGGNVIQILNKHTQLLTKIYGTTASMLKLFENQAAARLAQSEEGRLESGDGDGEGGFFGDGVGGGPGDSGGGGGRGGGGIVGTVMRRAAARLFMRLIPLLALSPVAAGVAAGAGAAGLGVFLRKVIGGGAYDSKAIFARAEGLKINAVITGGSAELRARMQIYDDVMKAKGPGYEDWARSAANNPKNVEVVENTKGKGTEELWEIVGDEPPPEEKKALEKQLQDKKNATAAAAAGAAAAAAAAAEKTKAERPPMPSELQDQHRQRAEEAPASSIIYGSGMPLEDSAAPAPPAPAPPTPAPPTPAPPAPVPPTPVPTASRVTGERAVLNAMGANEAGGSYDLAYGDIINKGRIVNNNKKNPGKTAEQFNGKKLSAMTLAEVQAFQKDRPKGTGAVGKYQFMPGTLADGIRILKLPSDTIFNASTQDQLGYWLLRGNKKKLERAGINATLGNLYMAHYIGSGGAEAVANAVAAGEGGQSVADVVTARYGKGKDGKGDPEKFRKNFINSNPKLATTLAKDFEPILQAKMETATNAGVAENGRTVVTQNLKNPMNGGNGSVPPVVVVNRGGNTTVAGNMGGSASTIIPSPIDIEPTLRHTGLG